MRQTWISGTLKATGFAQKADCQKTRGANEIASRDNRYANAMNGRWLCSGAFLCKACATRRLNLNRLPKKRERPPSTHILTGKTKSLNFDFTRNLQRGDSWHPIHP